MRAMLFAAGLGTRLRPITDTIPKALLPLGGKTLLQYQIEKLKASGVTDIVVNVHHFADKIIDYLRANDNFGCDIRISDERECLLDTGGGLRKALSTPITSESLRVSPSSSESLRVSPTFSESLRVSPSFSEPILALNVDILSNIDISSLIATHSADSLATLVVSQRQTSRYLLFDNDGCLRAWRNIATGEVRPTSVACDVRKVDALTPLAFSGMQVLSPRIFSLMDEVAKENGDKFSLIDLYLYCCEYAPNDSIRAFVPQDYRMMDVGKIDQLSAAEQFALSL